jgi:hypothetical protein
MCYLHSVIVKLGTTRLIRIHCLRQCFPTGVSLRVSSAGAKGSVRYLGKYKLINNIFDLNYNLNMEKPQKLYGGSTKRSSSCKGPASKRSWETLDYKQLKCASRPQFTYHIHGQYNNLMPLLTIAFRYNFFYSYLNVSMY